MLGLWKQLRGSLDACSSGKSGGHESGIPACKDCPKTRLAHLANERSPRETAKSQATRSEEHTSELQSRLHLVCRLLLEKKNSTHNMKRKSLTFSCNSLTMTSTIIKLLILCVIVFLCRHIVESALAR